MAANSWAKAGIQLASLVVLGRVLSPADYGLLGMVVAVTGVATLVGDLGLSLAALQSRTLSRRMQSNLFWVNVLVGTLIGLALVAVAPLLVAFYGRQELLGLTCLLAAAFPLNGMAVQFKVRLNRDGAFSRIVVADVGGSVLGLIVAVTAALLGAGYWALGLQLTVAALGTFVGLAARARWLPGLPRREAGIGRMLRFGANTFGVQLINYASTNVGNVALGRAAGAVPLGFYTRAWTLVSLPIAQLAAPLTRVVLPALSRLEGEAFQAALVRLQTVLGYVLLSTLSVLAATAPAFVSVVLGDRWAPSAPVIEVLAAGAAFQALGYIYYWGFLATAQTGLLFLGELPGRVVMIASVITVAHLGPLAVAAAGTVGSILIWATSTFVTGPRARLGTAELALRGLRPLAVFGAAYAVTRSVRLLWLDAGGIIPLADLGIELGLWIAVVAVAALIPGVRSDYLRVIAEARRLIGDRRHGAPRSVFTER